MASKISYSEIPEFQKDFKKLFKRFPSLEGDLEIAKKAAIELCHLQKTNNSSVFLLSNFYKEEFRIYKIKKFACRALKGRGNQSGIRVIYAFYPETLKVIFIEIYFKGDKENEDRERIKAYWKNPSF